MLPQLLNMIGGTKVRGSYLNRRASGQATSPETAITITAPSISQPCRASSKSFEASALKHSSGASRLRFTELSAATSGRTRSPRQRA